jgi:hypothetical protein
MIRLAILMLMIPLLATDMSVMDSQKVHFDHTTTSEESESPFRNVQVSGGKGKYSVIGEAATKERVLYYTVEDGHFQYVEETKLNLAKKFPEWSSFKLEINIPNDKLPENATLILNLYERDEGGNVTNTYPVVLEQFYK